MQTNKIDTSKLSLLPVPEGHKIRSHHIYTDAEGRLIKHDSLGPYVDVSVNGTVTDSPTEPRKLVATEARLIRIEDDAVVAQGQSAVNPKDTPIKKLGRAIAHNRCIKAFNKAATQESHE